MLYFLAIILKFQLTNSNYMKNIITFILSFLLFSIGYSQQAEIENKQHDQLIIRGTLSNIRKKIRKEKITRTALIMVGPALALSHDFVDSALYDPSIPHVLRPVVGVDLIEDHNT